MSDAPSGSQLTDDQVVMLYERSLNRAIIVHLSVMVLGAALAVLLYFTVEPWWLMIVLVVLTILASGMVQRILVLRVKCPACGTRVLGRIHSILQAKSITQCPGCDARLRS